ncbi:MAG: TonB-dependent receptor [Bacteroidales bacterium]|nr:TonB-dependent receptor [Bacteroidales bacterium]
MKRFLLTILVAFLSAASFAQTITGGIFAESGSPVSFANVVLMSADSVFLSGTITDENGKFSVEKSQNAKFLSVSCLGYETKILSVNDSFEKIVLKNSDLELEEITVSAGLPKTRIKDGAMVTDVQNTLLTKTLSGDKMLAKLPGVTLTKDGIEVFGKGTPEIYINNVKLRDNNELKNLDPKNVKYVEVINNPGAECGAEVESVIKIYTLKPAGDGFSFDALGLYSICEYSDYITKLNFNYRRGNLDVFGGVFCYDTKSFLQSETYDLRQTDALWETKQSESVDYKQCSMRYSGGVNYQFNAQNFAGIKYQFNDDSKDEQTAQGSLMAYKNGDFVDEIAEGSRAKCDKDFSHSLNAYYNGNVGGFSVDFNADIFTNYVDKSTMSTENADFQDDRQISTSDKVDSKMFAEKLVLGHKLFGGKINFGGENIFSDYRDNFKSRAEEFVPTVESRSRQTTTAAFLQYGYKFSDKWSVKAGLRYEDVDFKYFNGEVLDEETSRKYSSWFPSASLSFSPGDFEMNLSYTKKTKRPSYFMLRNSYMYGSRYFIESGNSALLPREISDFTYLVSWNFLQFSASYRDVKNYIMYYGTVDYNNPEVHISRPVNYNRHVQGLALNFSAAPEFGFYTPQFDLTFRKQRFEVESQSVTEKLNKPCLTAELDNCFDFESGWTFDLDVNFYGKGHCESNYFRSNYFVLDFCVSKSFLAGALNVEAGVSDITGDTRRDIKSLSKMGYMNIYDTYDTREFYLQIQYRFNPAKSKYKGTGAGNDEKERM